MTHRQTAHHVLVGLLFLEIAWIAGCGSSEPVRSESPTALIGTVSSSEGNMEGVVVTAQQEGASLLTAATTDQGGQYRFPRSHMDAGTYTLTIRAAGYVLIEPERASVQIGTTAPAELDLKLGPATTDQLAHQLTNLDWWTSMPGTPADKDLLIRKVVNCGFCHDMERTTRSRYTAEQWMPVIQRMFTYAADNSSACGPGSAMYCDDQTAGRFQVGSKPQPLEALSYGGADARQLAEYLESINLSGDKSTWDYQLRAMPRPGAEASRAIVTVYPIPRQPSVIHDLDVDSLGNVWYGDSGWGYLGKLDPRTGEFSEYEAPNYREDAAEGLRRVVGVQDVSVDPNDNVWAVVAGIADGKKMAYFDPEMEQWFDFEMPIPPWAFLPSFHQDQVETVWTAARDRGPDGQSGPLTAYRLDHARGEIDASHPIMVDSSGTDFSGPRQLDAFGFTSPVFPFCYQIDRDPQDDFLCADFYGSNIIKVDGRTGDTAVYPTLTPHAAPRRGRSDSQGRFWFAEFWGDRLGVLDPSTQSIQEFDLSTKYISPYAAAPDRNGQVWVSSNGSDRLFRVDPATGSVAEYLMPVYYDARKVVIDLSAETTTVWLPNKNLAQLIRIEILD